MVDAWRARRAFQCRVFLDFFLRMSLAASFARPKMIPELLTIASGQSVFAALWRVWKSSVLIFTLTWTVRFPLLSIPSIVTSVLFSRNNTVDTVSTRGIPCTRNRIS